MNHADESTERYLFNEMSAEERERFEDSFVGSDDLFYEIAERENALVDAYVRGELADETLGRFERSLAANPSRRQKVANARSIHELIRDERAENKTITIAERTGFLAGLTNLFSLGSPAFQFASIGLIAILAIAATYLFIENRRLGALESELAASRQREADLATRVENEADVAGELTAELDTERERGQRLEAEVARLRSTATTRPPAGNVSPTIATLVLSSVGIRGTSQPPKRLDLPAGVTRVSVLVGLATGAVQGDKVTVRLNGELVGTNLSVRIRNGEPTVALTLRSDKFKPGRNELTVADARNVTMATYAVATNDRP